MPERLHRLPAPALFGVAMLLVGSGLFLGPLDTSAFSLFDLILLPFAVVGVLVALRRPENPVGWLFLTFSVVAAFAAFADRYAQYSLPGAEWVAWLSSGIWHPAFGFFVFAFLLFPEGRLPSARWRPVALVAVLNYLVGAVIGLLWNPLLKEFFPDTDPPFHLPAYPIVDAAFSGFLLVNFGLLLLSAVSLVVRLRKATGAERQQIKWFVYAVALFAALFPPSVLLLGDGRLIVVLLPLVPLSAGIAIFRYRLYDIDLIINRTLVYGTLTAALALVYLGGVTGFQRLLSPLVGDGNQLSIVASTLAIAALFNPLRRRIQSFIDRRFYRQKYDAARTIEAFSVRLRGEMELDELNGDLVSTVHRTLRPEHASLWLRGPDEGARP